MKHLLLFFFLSFSLLALSQNQYNTYDEVPGNIKSYKPAYNPDFPHWAKILYTDTPINYIEINTAFLSWEKQNNKEYRAIRRYYKNWSKHISKYASADGTILLPNLNDYNNTLRLNQKSTYPSELRSGANWSFLGPKETFWLNESGATATPAAASWQVNIYSFDISDSDKNILYCGSETGYVSKSIDKGINWIQLGLNYNFGGGIRAVAIDPVNPDIVYVSGGSQIHITQDGGNSWSPIYTSGSIFNADKIIIDPSNPSKLFIAGDSGIATSTDGGSNWTLRHTLPTYDIHFHPTDNTIVYGLSINQGDFNLINSTDGGLNFNDYLSFPQGIQNAAGGLLAVSEDRPNAIYFLALSSDNTPYLYVGDFTTEIWDLKVQGNTDALDMNNWQGYYDLVLEVSDEDADIIYTGTASLFKSTDGGSSFSNIGGYGGLFPLHPDIQDMKIRSNGEVWVATDGGMNYSNDNYVSHHESRTRGIIGSDMWGFDQSWNEDLVIGGRYHNGNTSIADFYGDKALRMGGAESPTGWVRQGKSRHVAFDDLGAGWILPETAEGEPQGRFAFSKFPNMDEYGGRRSNILFHTNYYGTIYMGEGNGFWKSTNSGLSYELLYDFGNRVRWIQMSYSDPDIIYADIINEGLYKTEDGGLTWELKPSLTSSPNGNSNWSGRLFFAISPTDPDRIYACLQNGTWSSDLGQIFKSTDGGDTWENWTDGLSEYTKNIVAQPGIDGEDIVYLLTNARDQSAKVFIRYPETDQWEYCDNGFPAGFQLNLAIPFYRDGKLRASGNAGVWEQDLAMNDYEPIINPWVENQVYGCITDSIYFEDHSIVDYTDCEWRWEISPTPSYISDPNVRNPVVVLGAIDSYDVTMYLTKNGIEYSKTIQNMVSATSCPSIDDCSNTDNIPKDNWSIIYADSEETNFPGLASMAIDDDPSTIWHTRWTSGNDSYPHEIIVDMAETYLVDQFTYLPRQDGGVNGRIKEYELYISDDLIDWGVAVSTGEFINSSAPSIIDLATPTAGRYFRLVGLSEINDNIWSSAAELSVKGCIQMESSIETIDNQNLVAFPIPANDIINIPISSTQIYNYQIIGMDGKIYASGRTDSSSSEFLSFDLSYYLNGLYIIHLKNETGIRYVVKVIKSDE